MRRTAVGVRRYKYSCSLKLVRLPLSLPATLAALPSISEIPFLDSWFPDLFILVEEIVWRSLVDALAVEHDTC